MNQENEELLLLIKEAFSTIHKSENIYGRKNWTVAYFDKLKEIGLQNNYKVYSSSTSEMISEKNGGGEWLYDLIWSIEGTDESAWKQKYKGLKLICEAEWDTKLDAILYDFQKLAVGKAEIKIMLCQFNNPENLSNIIKSCEQSIDHSLYEDGSRYILVGSGNNEDEIKWVQLWNIEK